MSYRDQFYKNYYQTQASRYAEAPESDKIAHAEQILSKEILPLLPSNKEASILELACGHGTLLGLLQKKGYSKTSGVDIGDDQIEKAKALGVENVQRADIQTFLSSSSTTYDVIIGIDIIEHLTKSELLNLLESIKDHLKPSGKVIFRTPNCDAPLGSTFFLGDFTHEIYLNYFSAEQVMLAMGFNHIRIGGSYLGVSNPIKNFFRGVLWFKLVLFCKLVLFASARSSKKVLFTPNLIISAEK
ncbi:MAG: class I SAM-dependent methyltransferase [Flavobacteriales bacterium]|nr:class I SAM-dependent methyltransferase [Flavobacteriales bacterium]